MKSDVIGTTPFPNLLLDEVMPHLKDTEWRLLCVIVRQTWGWRDKKSRKRKESDWLTQSQLVDKTGRDRAALSRALDVLVRGQYVEVRDEGGRLLASPEQRRQNKGRLFYRLHPRLLARSRKSVCIAKREYQTRNSSSLLEHEAPQSEYHPAPKANTTKETETKENATKGFPQNTLNGLSSERFGDVDCTLDQAVDLVVLLDESHEYSESALKFILVFQQIRESSPHGNAESGLSRQDLKRLENLVASYPQLDWAPVLRSYFHSTSGYLVRRNHSLPAFLDSCHIFLIKTKNPMGKRI